MKRKLLLLTITLAMTAGIACAQNASVTTYIERTNVGPKAGTALGYEFYEGYEVGAFYQREVPALESAELVKPRFAEREFYGMYFSAPVLVRRNYNIKINARTGVVNNVSFRITPSAVANYKLNKSLEVQGAVGFRLFIPTAQLGIKVNIK